jgi:hypothetical protein
MFGSRFSADWFQHAILLSVEFGEYIQLTNAVPTAAHSTVYIHSTYS